MREEIAELLVELGSKRLVVGEDQRWPVSRGDHVCHRERLAGAGNAQQGLVLLVLFQPFG